MAAIDLTAATPGWTYRLTALGETWQEVIIPREMRFTVQSITTAFYLSGESNGDPSSPETPADGGAVGTHYVEIAAGSPYTERTRTRYPGGGSTVSIFVACSSGTCEFSLRLEEAEQ